MDVIITDLFTANTQSNGDIVMLVGDANNFYAATLKTSLLNQNKLTKEKYKTPQNEVDENNYLNLDSDQNVKKVAMPTGHYSLSLFC